MPGCKEKEMNKITDTNALLVFPPFLNYIIYKLSIAMTNRDEC